MATKYSAIEPQDLIQAINAAISVTDLNSPIVGKAGSWAAGGPLASSYNINNTNNQEALVVTACLEHAMNAEKAGPGALRATLKLARHALLGKPAITKTTQAIRPSRGPLEASLIDLCGADAGVVAKQFLDASKGLSRVSIQNARPDLSEIYIAKTSGHVFHPRQYSPGDVNLSNCRILCYDGHIQDVSQLDVQLQEASKTNTPFLVCARSFGDDIKNTSSVNFYRGTLKLLLCEFPLDNPTVNTFFDMSTITGCQVIDLQGGLTLPSLKFEDFPMLQRVEISKFGLVVFVNGSSFRTKAKLDELEEKASSATPEEAKIYRDRIFSLSPSRWDILIPENSRNKMLQQNLDRAFKVILAYKNSGAVVLSEAERVMFGAEIVPASTYKAAFDMSAALVRHLTSLSGVIVEDLGK